MGRGRGRRRVGTGSNRSRCSRCVGRGHNRRTCTFEPGKNADPPQPTVTKNAPRLEGTTSASTNQPHVDHPEEPTEEMIVDIGNISQAAIVQPTGPSESVNGVPNYPLSSEDEVEPGGLGMRQVPLPAAAKGSNPWISLVEMNC